MSVLVDCSWPKLSFNRAISVELLPVAGFVIVESVGVFGKDLRLFELELRLFILRSHDDVPLDSNIGDNFASDMTILS